MGRYSGAGSMMSAQRKKLAARLALPKRQVAKRRIMDATGVVIPNQRGKAKPGFTIRIDALGRHKNAASSLDAALKKMKKWDPKLDRPGQKRKPKN